MSELSERAYSAGWMDGLEFALWHAVLHGPFRYGQLQLEAAHVGRLMELAALCGGWIIFHKEEEEAFVPAEEWKQ